MKAAFMRADSPARRTSEASASAKPPPAAAPWTQAMKGWGTRRISMASSLMWRCPRRFSLMVNGCLGGGPSGRLTSNSYVHLETAQFCTGHVEESSSVLEVDGTDGLLDDGSYTPDPFCMAADGTCIFSMPSWDCTPGPGVYIDTEYDTAAETLSPGTYCGKFTLKNA